MPVIENIKVGKPDVDPATPAHVKGVPEGHTPGSLERMPGFVIVEHAGADKVIAKATTRRSTGISDARRKPIHPDMPLLTPP